MSKEDIFLKQVKGALNEKDAQLFKKRQRELNMTQHGIITKLAKGVIHSKVIREFLEDQKAVATIVIYGFALYTYAYMTILLF